VSAQRNSLAKVPAQRARNFAAPTQTKAQRLADAAGASPEIDAAGRSSVVFGAPDRRTPDGADSVRTALDVPTRASVSLPPMPSRPRDDPAAVDDLYERLLERLRRDLLIERERSAGLAYDLY